MKKKILTTFKFLLFSLSLIGINVYGQNINNDEKINVSLGKMREMLSALKAVTVNHSGKSIPAHNKPQDVFHLVKEFHHFHQSKSFPSELSNHGIIGHFYLEGLKILYRGRGTSNARAGTSAVAGSGRLLDGWYHTYDQRIQNRGETGIIEFKKILNLKNILDKNLMDELINFINNYDFNDIANRISNGFPPDMPSKGFNLILSTPRIKSDLLSMVRAASVRTQAYDKYLPPSDIVDIKTSMDPEFGPFMNNLTLIGREIPCLGNITNNLVNRHQNLLKIKSTALYPYLAKSALGSGWQEKILAMEQGIRPLPFATDDLFISFLSDLSHVLQKHVSPLIASDAIQILGSSTTFFSYNLFKGNDTEALAENSQTYSPSRDDLHFFDKGKLAQNKKSHQSDIDIHLYISSLSDRCHKRGVQGAEDPNRTTYFDVATMVENYPGRGKFMGRDLPGCGATFLEDFSNTWSSKLEGRKINFSVYIKPENHTSRVYSEKLEKNVGTDNYKFSPFYYSILED